MQTEVEQLQYTVKSTSVELNEMKKKLPLLEELERNKTRVIYPT